jgi:FkbM family methyltransferase
MPAMSRLRDRLHSVAKAPGVPPPVASLARACWLTLEIAGGAPTRRAVLVSIVRYWWWQATRRTRRGQLAVALMPHDVRFIIPAWSQLGGSIVANGTHELSMTDFLACALRPGDHLHDVGANIGLYSVIAAAAGAVVAAYEPDRIVGSALKANVIASGLAERISVFEMALADYDGESQFIDGRDVSSRLTRSGETPATANVVSVAKLDSLVNTGPSRPTHAGMSFLKVDAERSSMAVLHGAAGYLAAAKPVVIVESWGEGEARNLLVQSGYRIYDYDHAARSLVAASTDRAGQTDLLGIADEHLPEICSRLDAASGPALARPRIIGWGRQLSSGEPEQSRS